MSVKELLAYATPDDAAAYEECWLGYTETMGDPSLRQVIAASYDTMQADDTRLNTTPSFPSRAEIAALAC